MHPQILLTITLSPNLLERSKMGIGFIPYTLLPPAASPTAHAEQLPKDVIKWRLLPTLDAGPINHQNLPTSTVAGSTDLHACPIQPYSSPLMSIMATLTPAPYGESDSELPRSSLCSGDSTLGFLSGDSPC